MDPLYAKAQGKAGSSSTRAKSSKKQKRSTTTSRTSQSPGQPSGRPQLGSGEPTAESRSRSKRSKKQSSSRAPSESSKAASTTMHLMNLIDVAVGISLIVEGATMIPEVGGSAAAIALGVLLLLSSFCATVGYFSKSMNRVGLVVSMVLSVIACLIYIGVFVWALVDWDSLSTFFDVEQQFLEGKNITIAVAAVTLAVFDGIKLITTSMTRKQLLEKDSQSKSSGRSDSTRSTSSRSLFSWFGFTKKRRADDFVMFDDNASMESALLWSKDGAQPSSDDYLEFVPEHERGLVNYTSNLTLPKPPEDKMDY